MPDPNRIEAGQRFAHDLRRIREDRGLSVEVVNDETKIPRSLIDSFEDSGLFDHPTFNEVYLRSFVRTYADIIGIDPDATIDALASALQGRYQGELAHQYLGEAPSPEPTPPTPEQHAPEQHAPEQHAPEQHAPEQHAPEQHAPEQHAPEQHAPEQRAPEQRAPEQRAPEQRAPEQPSSEASSDASPRREADASRERPARSQPHAEGSERERLSEEPVQKKEPGSPAPTEAPPQHEAGPTAPADTPTPRPRRPRHPRRDEGRSSTGLVLGTLGVLTVVALLVVWLMREPEAPAASVEEAAPAADTTTAVAEQSPPPPTPVDVGETLDVTVVAAGGAVRGLRVQRDEDLRRPYWIDEGNGTLFVVADRIAIQNPASGTDVMDRLRLLVEGYAYPMPERDDRGRVVLTRQDVQTWLQQPPGETDALVPADTVGLP